MNNLFELAQQCLYQTTRHDIVSLTHTAFEQGQKNGLSFISNKPILPIYSVSFPEKPELLLPRDMPKRKLTTPEGVRAFFHAIAHVEFMAIYLAWDIIYRFQGLPEKFYRDWLQIAFEEAQHFALITAHLKTLGLKYGDLPAHAGLWQHAEETKDDVLARLALIPRCMEARGLDVTPSLIKKFEQMGDNASVALLTHILKEEITHVERGSYWFTFFCQQQGLASEATFKHLIAQFYHGGAPKGPFNRELRIIAGFSHAELDWLESHS